MEPVKGEQEMRGIFLFSLAALMVLAVAMPASAGSRSYANDLLDEWTTYADDMGYEVFYSDVDSINEDDSVSYEFDLDPGYYYFVAEGGEDIEDLDMYVYDEDGNELASDTLDDNYPMCEIELDEYMSIEVEISAYSFSGRESDDYFAFVGASGEYEAPVESDVESLNGTNEIMVYWEDWANEQGFDVIFTDDGSIRTDNSQSYDFELSEGTYHVYAESTDDADDIDLYVYGEDGDEIISDTLTDNYPICSFDMDRRGDVSIEVSGYDFGSGRSTDYAIILASENGGSILSGDHTGTDHGTTTQPTVVTDQADLDYVNGLHLEAMDQIASEGYQNIFDQVDMLYTTEPEMVHITLGRGDYIVYAEGGLRIRDLDLSVYDEDGDLVAEDTLDDNAPYCEFSTRDSSSFDIDITPYEMESGWESGYYLIVIVRE
jgi:hypothetical protein